MAIRAPHFPTAGVTLQASLPSRVALRRDPLLFRLSLLSFHLDPHTLVLPPLSLVQTRVAGGAEILLAPDQIRLHLTVRATPERKTEEGEGR